MLLLLLGPGGMRSARADFDIVGHYQKKVKEFESVYYLTGDAEWQRDRRVFELFSSGDAFPAWGGAPVSYWNLAGGVLFNVRPRPQSQVQVGFFHLWSGNQVGQNSRFSWEALHGARLAIGEYLELSAGGYWRKAMPAPYGDDLLRASGFFELGSPWLFARSSYVVGLNESGSTSLARWDLRYDYDHFSFVDSVAAGVVRYDYASPKWLFTADIRRLGHPKFKFFTLESRFVGNGLAWLRSGLDILWQSSRDYNLQRRGHFGTGLALQAFYTLVSPEGADIYGRSVGGGFQHGTRCALTLQFPFKWFLAVLAVASAAASGVAAGMNKNLTAFERQRQTQQAAEFAAKTVAGTVQKPEDTAFMRLSVIYSFNDPESFLQPVPDVAGRHRIAVTVGVIY